MRRSRCLFVGVVCLAVLSPSRMGRAQSSSAPADGDPATRKVWTNADMPTLRENSAISTVGQTSGARSASTSAHRPASGHQDVKWYSDQISKLQAQLPAINDKIAKLQAGIDGKFTGDSQTSTRPKNVGAGSWPVELVELQKQRGDIESRIGELRDQARRQGIPPNALP